MAQPIKVVVHGAQGKVGQEVVKGICRDPELEITGAVEKQVSEEWLTLPGSARRVPFSSNVASLLERSHPDVLIDFSIAEATRSLVPVAVKRKTNLVIGTTGLTAEDLAEIERLTRVNEVGAIVAPNFALGAVVMIYLAKLAAKFFDYAEIIEMHHEQKADAPSGTALSTAKVMLESRGKPFLHPQAHKETLPGTRGGELGGITIHSMRLPGLLAHQEIVLGMAGQTLSLRHDTISRECYIPGVLLAIKRVVKLKGLTYGLDALLGL